MAIKIAVLGAGPGGYVAALRAAQLGADVTLIEKENLGGTCLNWGCIPSKIMKASAELLEGIHKASAFGITMQGKACVDMPTLQERKERLLDIQRKGIHALLKHRNIRYVSGTGRFEKVGAVHVDLSEGGTEEVFYDKVILALGTTPFSIPAFPFDHKTILSSNDILCLQTLPESIVIVGGGVIGCEFAFILRAFGVKVTVVEAMPRVLPLPSVDQECSKVLQRCMKKAKITLLANRAVKSIDHVEGGARVTIGASPFMDDEAAANIKEQQIDAENVLVVVGRASNACGIGLENIGVLPDERGWIAVNERMETSSSGVFAIGDIIGPSKPMLAHVASTEGMVAAANALGGEESMEYRCVPGGIFSMPEVGNVGYAEEEAKNAGLDVRADTVLFRTSGKAQVIGEIDGFVKIVSDRNTGQVLGVHIVGPHATDLIAEGTLAVNKNLTVQDLVHTIHAHPTLSECIFEASLKAADMSLHG